MLAKFWERGAIAPARMVAIAQNTFLDLVRARVFYLLLLYGVILGLAVLLLPELAAGNTFGKILLDAGLAGSNLIGLAVAVFIGPTLIDKEIERRTILLSVAKPISRTEFVLGKHGGLVAVLAALLAASTGLNLIALTLTGSDFGLSDVLWSSLFSWLELSLVGAAAVLFGTFMSSLLASFLTLAVYLMGHISRDLLTIGIQLENARLQRLTEGLYLVLPDLERLNLKNVAAYGLIPGGITLLGDAVYGLLYTAILLGIAVLIFARREF